MTDTRTINCPRCGTDWSELAVVRNAARLERERIIEVIANEPITITFKEPVTEIDVFRYHADIIKAILKGTR
jgi:hypothetical protein